MVAYIAFQLKSYLYDRFNISSRDRHRDALHPLHLILFSVSVFSVFIELCIILALHIFIPCLCLFMCIISYNNFQYLIA